MSFLKCNFELNFKSVEYFKTILCDKYQDLSEKNLLYDEFERQVLQIYHILLSDHKLDWFYQSFLYFKRSLNEQPGAQSQNLLISMYVKKHLALLRVQKEILVWAKNTWIAI